MNKVKFMGSELDVRFSSYTNNGRVAILLELDGERYCTASVNLPDLPIKPDQVAIKDYSECRGMLDALMAAGIVSKPVEYVPSGYVTIPICNLLVLPPDVRKECPDCGANMPPEWEACPECRPECFA